MHYLTRKYNMLYSISGMDLQFEWEEVDAFVKQPDGSLFSWFERFHCYNHLIYGIVSQLFHTHTILYHDILPFPFFPTLFASIIKQI